jgi:hypothetical protein
MAGAWWDRDTVLDDHLRHDVDPEEHYGLFDGARQPKPASEIVRAMYGGDEAGAAIDGPARAAVAVTPWPNWLVAGLIGGAAVLYLLAVVLRQHDRRTANRNRLSEPPPLDPPGL